MNESDNIFNTYDRNLYKIGYSPDSNTADTSNNLNIADPSNALAGAGSANGDLNPNPQDPDTSNSGSNTATVQQDIGNIQSGKTKFDNTQSGYILGTDEGIAKFYIGNTANYLNWNGSALVISGNISATTGTIGGFVIGATTITGSNLVLDSANQKITLGTNPNQIVLDASTGIISAQGASWSLNGDGTVTGFSNPYSVNADETITSTFSLQIPITIGGGGTTLTNGYFLASNAGVNGISGSLLGTVSSNFADSFEWDGNKVIRLQDTFSVDVGTAGSTSGSSVGFGFAVVANSLDLANNGEKIAMLADSTGVIFGVTSDGSNSTLTSLGVAYTRKKGHRCVIVWNPVIPSVSFYIDGVLKGTNTTNIPTTSNTPKICISASNSVSGTCFGRFTIPVMSQQI